MVLKKNKVPYQKQKFTWEEAREIRIADAFAHLAVTNCEVVAVSAHRSPTANSLDLAAYANSEESPSEPKPPVPKSFTIPGILKTLFFMKNAARDETQTHMINSLPIPTVGLPVPLALNGQDLGLYVNNMRQAW